MIGLFALMSDAGPRVPVKGPIRMVTGLPDPAPWWQDPVVWWCLLALAVASFVGLSALYIWRQSVLRRPADVAFVRLAKTLKLTRPQAAAVKIAAERVGVSPIAVLLTENAASRVPGIEAVLPRG